MGEITEKDIKQEFIKEELDLHGEFLMDILSEVIEEKDLINTEHLLSSLQYQTLKEGENYKLSLSYAIYGRFIEIRQNKSKIAENSKTNHSLWGIKRQKKGKDAKWYSKNVYGGMNRLIGRIMYGMSDETRARLINILNNSEYRGESGAITSYK